MVLLTACGGGNSRAVSFSVFGDPEELAAYEGLVAAFEAKFPEIDIELRHVPGQNDYRQRLATEFAAGFGTPALTPLLIRANRSWTVTLRSTAGTWTGTGPQARPNKPVGELQWGTAAGGPFANMSTTAVTIGTGAATAGTTVNLYLRSVYQWTLDRPGAYSLPLQLTITAP